MCLKYIKLVTLKILFILGLRNFKFSFKIQWPSPPNKITSLPTIQPPLPKEKFLTHLSKYFSIIFKTPMQAGGRCMPCYIPIHKVLEQPWRHFTSLKQCKCYQIPHPPLRVVSAPNKTKTNYHWLNHLQKLHTH